MEKIKNTRICGWRNSTKASNPIAELQDRCAAGFRTGGEAGTVNEYIPISKPAPAERYNCPAVCVHPIRSTIHMAAMNPTVPQTRMGGKVRTTSKLFLVKTW